MTTPVSAHSIILARQPYTTPGTFTDIAELNQVAMPELSRNEFDATVQNRNIDSYVLGVLRRKSVQLQLNWIPSDGTHDHLTGVVAAMLNNQIDGYKFYQVSGSNMIWIASGQVQAFVPKTPTDGILGATVTIRFSGLMSINGVLVGS